MLGNDRLDKGSLYVVLLAGCVVALTATFVFADAFQHDTAIKRFAVSGVAYDREAKRIYEHQDATTSSSRSFHLAMTFETPFIRLFDNAFQTAPANKGLRLELSRPGSAVLVVAAQNSAGFVPFVITKQLSLNRWHTFDMNIDLHNHIVVTFDGKAVVNETAPNLSYDVSDIAIGTGLTQMRPFYGRIRDVSISYVLFAHSGTAVIMAVRAGCVILALALLYLLWRSQPASRRAL